MKKLCLSLLLLVLLCGCVYLSGELLRPTDPDGCIAQINSFHSLPENSVDVIAYGSSRCWRGFSPAAFQEEYAVTCYNYACNWQLLNTTWLFFNDSLLTQTPKVALIETGFVGTMKMEYDMDGELYYTRALAWTDCKREYLRQCFGTEEARYERYLSYFVPLVFDHANWEALSADSFRLDPGTMDFKETLGFVPSENVTPVTVTCAEEKLPPEESEAILDDIVRTCRERGIALVFYTAPYEGGYAYTAFMEEYAAENGCQYLGMFDIMEGAGLDAQTDFSDAGHLNTSGSVKLTHYLGDFLLEQGLMPEPTL